MNLIPALTIKILKKEINTFHFFGITGFIIGNLLGAMVCHQLKLHVGVILLMGLTSAFTFFLLAFGAKIITGKEVIVYYHHEIGILLMCSAVLKGGGLPVLPYLDVTILGIATFLAFGRIGCFSVGCCHGQPANKGVTYSHAHVKAGFTWYYEGIPLLPVQLIESAFVFIFILTGTYLLINRHLQPGTILVVYTVVYGSFRFIIEFFRGDAERPYVKGLSEAQWTTLLLVTVSLVLGYADRLPLYNWHLMLFIVMVLGSGLLVINSNVKNSLTKPIHIRQIAKALYGLENNSSGVIESSQHPQEPVSVVHTDMGLYLSKGEGLQNGKLMKHYTISFKNGQVLTSAIVTKLAVIIGHIDKNKRSFTVHEKNNGVFQILFEE